MGGVVLAGIGDRQWVVISCALMHTSHLHSYTHTNAHTHAHTRTHAHAHTHTHTHTHSLSLTHTCQLPGAALHELVEQVVGEATVQSTFAMSTSGRKKEGLPPGGGRIAGKCCCHTWPAMSSARNLSTTPEQIGFPPFWDL